MSHRPPSQHTDRCLIDPELQRTQAQPVSFWAACSDTAAIDTRITEMTNNLYQLQVERLDVPPHRGKSHDTLTSSLPVEICIKIFAEVLPNIEQLDERSPPYLLAAPLVLSWVCHRWRQIIHNSPDLWTQMTLSLKATQALDNMPRLVEEWLERSGNARPLFIMLSIDPLFDENHSQNCKIQDILNLLAQHSHRFTYLSLAAISHYMSRLSFRQNIAASLKSLRLIGLTVKGARNAVWLCEPKPRPTSLTLRNLRWDQLVDGNTIGASVSLHSRGILIDPSVLNDLTVSQIELEDCLTFFRLAPTIKTCTISCLGEFNRTGTFDSRIRRLPNTPSPQLYDSLEELTFLDLNAEHSQFILNALDFPSLRKFSSVEKRRRYHQTYGMIHCLKNHIKRADAKLASLYLDNLRCHGNVKSLVKALISVAGPSLADLSLEHLNYMDENPLQIINGIFGDLSCLPGLRFIRVYSPANERMHSLHSLVTSAYRLAVYNKEPLSIVLTTTPEVNDLHTSKDVLNHSQVLDILEKMKSEFTSTRVLQGRLTEGPWNPDTDITADIIAALSGTINQP